MDGPGSQALQVELLQRGPHGDLVVGSADIPLSTLKERETMVQWVEVKGPARSAMGAELHAVLRCAAQRQQANILHVCARLLAAFGGHVRCWCMA